MEVIYVIGKKSALSPTDDFHVYFGPSMMKKDVKFNININMDKQDRA